MWLIILALVVIGFILYRKFFKLPKCGSFNLISGGVKSGKSSLTLALCLHYFRVSKRRCWIYNHLIKYIDWGNIWWKDLEKPLLYSNIPLRMPYVKITRDLLLRQKRFRYGSIVFLDEASLVADSMLGKEIHNNNKVNNQLLLFCKLIGHELGPAGKLFCNTQCIGDLHFAFRRVCSNYLYIHSCLKLPLLPLCIFRVRELFYSDDNSSMINVADDDVEQSLRLVITSSKYRKKFDAFCYSVLTDNLPVSDTLSYSTDLKTRKITSFRDYFNYLGEGEEDESK